MFKVNKKLHIRFNDIDAFRHVNNAVYLSYFEDARVEYFNSVFKGAINWQSEGLILAKSIVEYKSPIFFEDDITIKIRCARLGKSSFDFEYQLVKEHKGMEVVCATGTTVMVCYNYLENKVIQVPNEWVKILSEFDQPND